MWEKLRGDLLQYAGIGWTVTGCPIGIGYIARIQSATPDELIKIAAELGIDVIIQEED